MLEILLVAILGLSIIFNILLIMYIVSKSKSEHRLTEEELEMLRKRLRRIKMLEEGK